MGWELGDPGGESLYDGDDGADVDGSRLGRLSILVTG